MYAKRVLAVIAVVAVSVLGGSAGAYGASKYLSSPIYVQEQPNWCWVATSKSVIKFLTGATPSQCTVYKWGKGTSSCPDGTGSFGADVANALTNGGVWVGTMRSSTISFDSVKFELNANRPVMARWAWSGTAVGHVLVIRGFNDTGSALSYIDPEKSSYQVASYSAFVSSGTRSWTHTRDGIS